MTYSLDVATPRDGHEASTRKRDRAALGGFHRVRLRGRIRPAAALRHAALLRSARHVDERNRLASRHPERARSLRWRGAPPVRGHQDDHASVGRRSVAVRPPGGAPNFPAASPTSCWRASVRSPRRTPCGPAADCSNAARCASSPRTGIAGLGQIRVNNATELAHALDAIDARGNGSIRRGHRAESGRRDHVQRRPGPRGGSRRHILRHAVPDDEQSRRGGLRRLGDHRGAGRLRRAAGLAVARRHPARDRPGARLRRRGERCFPGFFASRRNYDVAQGRDASGSSSFGRARAIVAAGRRERRGNRRAGSVSRRSVAADRACDVARSLRRCAGAAGRTPSSISRGVDPHVGPLTKYAWTEPHADAR